MAITIVLKGTDLKVDDGSTIEYYPVSEVKQIAIGTKVELYRNNELVRGDDESEYSSPSGTAEQICDAISELSPSGGIGSISENVKSKINRIEGAADYDRAFVYDGTEPTNVVTITHTGTTDLGAETIIETITYVDPEVLDSNITDITYS